MVSLRPRTGFSLIEALIATVLGALVIGLVVSVVVAQGGYFSDVHSRADLQESVRSSADILREELQAVIRGGIMTAESDRLVARVPVSMGVVCGYVQGPAGKGKGKGKGKGALTTAPVYLPLPGGGVGSGRVSWYGIRDSAGQWVYRESTWESLLSGGGNPAGQCEDEGADTQGATGDFHRLSGFQAPALPDEGDLMALFAEIEFLFDDSALTPGRIALFRREGSGAPVEFATGLTTASGFQYRRQGQTAFEDDVTGGQVAEIVELRVRTVAESLDQRGAAGPLSYDWDLRIPLRNVP